MAAESRPVGLTKDAGWQVGARKTLPINAEAAWDLINSVPGLNIWLGPVEALREGDQFELESGVTGKIRVYQHGSHIRLGWQLPGWPRASTLQVRVVDNGDRSVIAFHQENLPNQAARAERKTFFKEALAQLADLAIA